MLTLTVFSDALVPMPLLSNASCSDLYGFISLNASGGSYPYGYTVTNASGISAEIPEEGTYPLPPGMYELLVRDINGCNATTTVTIYAPGMDIQYFHFIFVISFLHLPLVDTITVNITTTPAVCHANGTGFIVVAGGTEPYQIRWNNMSQMVAVAGSISLYAGEYFVIVEDDHGCLSSSQIATVEFIGMQSACHISLLSHCLAIV